MPENCLQRLPESQRENRPLLRQELTLQPWLAWNSLNRPGCPSIRDPPIFLNHVFVYCVYVGLSPSNLWVHQVSGRTLLSRFARPLGVIFFKPPQGIAVWCRLVLNYRSYCLHLLSNWGYSRKLPPF